MFNPETTTVREIVAGDFRAAGVFQQHGLDFCCGGGKTISDACAGKGVDTTELLAELDAVLRDPAGDVPEFGSWSLGLLADHIAGNHHMYVRTNLPMILLHAEKVARVHGNWRPEVVEISKTLKLVSGEMLPHMQKEEQILFPYIKALERSREAGRVMPRPPFGSVANPIRMMESEHETAGELMATIRRLSSGFAPPEGACMTYRVLYQELEAFEKDLHQHIHLENNILFPKALDLESGPVVAGGAQDGVPLAHALS